MLRSSHKWKVRAKGLVGTQEIDKLAQLPELLPLEVLVPRGRPEGLETRRRPERPLWPLRSYVARGPRRRHIPAMLLVHVAHPGRAEGGGVGVGVVAPLVK